ncbi:hypothetical protein FRC11_001821, partial [Ceratobasidium sp. 423]
MTKRRQNLKSPQGTTEAEFLKEMTCKLNRKLEIATRTMYARDSEPMHMDGDTISDQHPNATASPAHTPTSMCPKVSTMYHEPTAQVSDIFLDSTLKIPNSYNTLMPSTKPLPQESVSSILHDATKHRHALAPLQVTESLNLCTCFAPTSEAIMPSEPVSRAGLSESSLAPSLVDTSFLTLSVDTRVMQAPQAKSTHSIACSMVDTIKKDVVHTLESSASNNDFQLPCPGTTSLEASIERPESMGELNLPPSSAMNVARDEHNQLHTSRVGSKGHQSIVSATTRLVNLSGSVTSTVPSPSSSKRPVVDPKLLETVKAAPRSRIHRRPTPIPQDTLALPTSMIEPHTSIDTRVHTPSKPQENLPESIINRSTNSSPASSCAQQRRESLEESTSVPLAKLTVKLIPMPSVDTHTIRSGSPIDAAARTQKSMGSGTAYMLLEAESEHPHSTRNIEHYIATALLALVFQLVLHTLLMVYYILCAQVFRIGSTLIGITKRATQRTLDAVLTPPTLALQESRQLINSATCTTASRATTIIPVHPDDTHALGNSTHLLNTPVSSTGSQMLNLDPMLPSTPDRSLGVMRCLERLKERSESARLVLTAEATLPSEPASQTYVSETPVSLSPHALDLTMAESTYGMPKPPTPRPIHPLVSILSTGREKTWVQAPIELQESTATSCSSLDNCSPPQEQLCVEPTPERLAKLLARPAPVPSSIRALKEDVTSEQQENIRFQGSPSTASTKHPQRLGRAKIAESAYSALNCQLSAELSAETHVERPAELIARPAPNPPVYLHMIDKLIDFSFDQLSSCLPKPASGSIALRICTPPGIMNTLALATSPITQTTQAEANLSIPSKPKIISKCPRSQSWMDNASSACNSRPLCAELRAEPSVTRSAETIAEILPNQLMDKLNNRYTMDWLGTSTSMLPETANILPLRASPSSADNLRLATHTICTESTLELLKSESHQVVSSRTSTTNLGSCPEDPALPMKVPTEPTPEQLAELVVKPKSLSYSLSTRDNEGEKQESIRLTTLPASVQAEEHFLPQVCASRSSIRALTSTTSAATRITSALSIESTLSEGLQRPVTAQIPTASSHLCHTDSSLQDEVPAKPPPDRIAHISLNSSVAPPIKVRVLDETSNRSNDVVLNRLSTSYTELSEESSTPHIPSPPAPIDSEVSALRATMRTAQDLVAELIPRMEATHEHTRPSRPAQGVPSRADHINRQTSLGDLCHPRTPNGPADRFELPILFGSEGEPSKHRPPAVEQERSTSSVHSHHRSEALPRVEPNTTRRINCEAPLRSYTANNPVVTAQPLNKSDLPAHIRARLDGLRQLSNSYKDVQSRARLRSQLAPIRKEDEGGNDPPSYHSYYDSSNECSDRKHNPSRGPPNKSGDCPDRKPVVNIACVHQFSHALVHFDAKSKPVVVPDWYIDFKAQSKWIISIDDMVKHGNYSYIQHGQLAPPHLTSHALRWQISFNTLDKLYNRLTTADWSSLNHAITICHLNRVFMKRNKGSTVRRRLGHNNCIQESPESDINRGIETPYILRGCTSSKLIAELINCEPEHWTLFIDKSIIDTWVSLSEEVAWYEEKPPKGESVSVDMQQRLYETHTRLSDLEIDDTSSPEVDRSGQESHKYLSNDTYTPYIESETDKEAAPKVLNRTLRVFSVLVSAYIHEDSDVTQQSSGGNIVTPSLRLSCKINYSMLDQVYSMIDIHLDMLRSNGVACNHNQACLKRTVPLYVHVGKEIESIQAYEPYEAKSDDNNCILHVIVPTSKQRHVAPGGETRDKCEIKETLANQKRNVVYWWEIDIGPLDELQMHLGRSNFSIILRHAALAWISEGNKIICEPKTYKSIFPADPGTQVTDKAEPYLEQTGVPKIDLVSSLTQCALTTTLSPQINEQKSLRNPNIVVTLRAPADPDKDAWSKLSLKSSLSNSPGKLTLADPTPILHLLKSPPILSTRSMETALVVLTNSITNNRSKVSPIRTYLSDSNTSIPINQALTFCTHEPRPWINDDSLAQTSRRTHPLAQCVQEELADTFASLVINTLEIAQGYQYKQDKMVKAQRVVKSNNIVLKEQRPQRRLNKKSRVLDKLRKRHK